MTNSKQLIDEDGIKRWFNSKGELHRKNGPAVIYANGDKTWRLNGIPHRIDGPTFCWMNDYKIWYLEGECIRRFQCDY